MLHGYGDEPCGQNVRIGSTSGTSERAPPPSSGYCPVESKSLTLWNGCVVPMTGVPRAPTDRLWPLPTIPFQSKGTRNTPVDTAASALASVLSCAPSGPASSTAPAPVSLRPADPSASASTTPPPSPDPLDPVPVPAPDPEPGPTVPAASPPPPALAPLAAPLELLPPGPVLVEPHATRAIDTSAHTSARWLILIGAAGRSAT